MTTAMEGSTGDAEAEAGLEKIAAFLGGSFDANKKTVSAPCPVPGCAGSVSIRRFPGRTLYFDSGRHSRDAIIIARTPIGGRFQPHCTAVGKAILAFLPTPQIWDIVKRNGMPWFTSSTIVSYKALQEELDLTRRRGYAVYRQSPQYRFRQPTATQAAARHHVQP